MENENRRPKLGRIAASLFLTASASVLFSARAGATTIPVGIQAAEWPGSPRPSSARTNAPVTFGVPLPDSAGITCSPTGSPLPFNSSVSQIQLLRNGSPAPAQFRCLGLWPSGKAEWVLVDAQLPTFTEGTLDSSLTLSLGSGGGNTGPAMAVQCTGSGSPATGCLDGNHILVNTGAATFLIKEANYNLFDQVTVGATTLVSRSNHALDDGLALMGPKPGLAGQDAVSCPNGAPSGFDPSAQPCDTLYDSNNDSASNCAIEDNGPLRSVVMCQGDLKDSAGNIYMHWRTRSTFWANHSDVKLDAALRNADLSTTGMDFASAYKEFNFFDARLTLNLAPGTRSTAFGGGGNVISATLNAGTSDTSFVYQGHSVRYASGNIDGAPDCTQETDRCTVSPIVRSGANSAWTYAQDGFQITKNGVVLASGSGTQYPDGWADENDVSGNGVELGAYMMSAYWPGALQFASGGGQARVSFHPDQTLFVSTSPAIRPYVQRWPAYTLRTLYFNFHSGPLPNAADSFLAFQQRLLARLPVSSYNAATNAATGDLAMMLPMVDPVQDDSYYNGISKISCASPGGCLGDIPDKQTWPLSMIAPLYYGWMGGSTNQLDEAWSFIRNFLTRGCANAGGSCGALSLTGSTPGRFIWGENFYHLVIEGSIPRSDFGGWRTVCPSAPCPKILGKWGYPDRWNSINGGMRQWEDDTNGEAHLHTAGLVDYYYLTGDAWAAENLQQGYKDIALNQTIPYNNPLAGYNSPGYQQFNATREMGHWLEMIARESLYLCAIGDADCGTPSSPRSLLGAENAAAYSAFAPALASGYPAGWTDPTGCTSLSVPTCTSGTSPVRGFVADNGFGATCLNTADPVAPCDNQPHRISEAFMQETAEEGLHYFNIAERSMRGPGWKLPITLSADGSQTNVPVMLGDQPTRELIYGISNGQLQEGFVNTGDFRTSGFGYYTFLNYLNATPPCNLNQPDCSHAPGAFAEGYGENYLHFFGVGSQTGSTVDLAGRSWQQKWELYIRRTGSADEWESAEQNAVTSLILAHNPGNPTSYPLASGIATLQTVPVTVSPSPCVGPATCTITWSQPTGLISQGGGPYVLKDFACATGGTDCPSSGKQIVDWLAFHDNCLTSSTSGECTNGTGLVTNNPCFGGMNAVDGSGCWEAGKTPDTHWNWFASADAATQPAATATTYTFTAQPGMTYTFALKAWKTGTQINADSTPPARPQGLALE